MKVESLRKAYGDALVALGDKDNRIVALEADLGKSTMSISFGKKYPDRYFQMGIAEQNMISTAAGLALTGKIPFASSFAVFSSGRPYDQIRSSIAIPNLHVIICGSSAGLSDYGDGKTHQSIDDIALMRVLPHMTVLCPCDAHEVHQMMKAALTCKGPVYIRICRADLPVLTESETSYSIGKMTELRSGKDIVIFACGVMVSQSLKAAEILAKQNIDAKVVNLSTIKPLDVKRLKAYVKGMKAVITAEEHNKYCGMGSAVAEVLCETGIPIGMVAVDDCFGTSAENYDKLLEAYHLMPEDIVAKALSMLRK